MELPGDLLREAGLEGVREVVGRVGVRVAAREHVGGDVDVRRDGGGVGACDQRDAEHEGDGRLRVAHAKERDARDEVAVALGDDMARDDACLGREVGDKRRGEAEEGGGAREEKLEAVVRDVLDDRALGAAEDAGQQGGGEEDVGKEDAQERRGDQGRDGQPAEVDIGAHRRAVAGRGEPQPLHHEAGRRRGEEDARRDREERGQTGGGGDVGQDLMQPVRGLSGVDVPVEGEAEGEFSADPLTDEPADDARDERGDERRSAPDPFVRHVPHGARAGMGPGGS